MQKYLNISIDEVNKSITAGFDLAVLSGPLCQEPIIGAIFIVEDLKIMEEVKNEENGEITSNKSDKPDNLSNHSIDEEEKMVSDSGSPTKEKKQNLYQIDSYGPLSGQVA